MTRNGKIARLPRAIRDRLNQQIQDGVPGKDLVRWLNGMNEVVDILAQQFNTDRITEQNLSEWKQGGYQDWLKHQERRDWVRRISDEAEDITDDAGVMPWMERVGAMFEVVLGKVVEQQAQAAVETPEQLGALLTLSRELARHRQLAQDAARWRTEEIRRQERENPKDIDERIDRAQKKALAHFLVLAHRQTTLRDITKGMSPENVAKFEKAVRDQTLKYLRDPESIGFAESSDADEADPSESDSIQLDPTPNLPA
ncbi:MAG: hypothetical protein KDK97_18130 [Verrucomicrobiales bacterium]|nr:hypothetical protein [Verrucomicrobiales bacterium]